METINIHKWACLSASIAIVLSIAGSAAADPDKSLKYSVSWIGNNFNGKREWVLQDVADIFVENDGTLFTHGEWEEGGANVQQ